MVAVVRCAIWAEGRRGEGHVLGYLGSILGLELEGAARA